MKKKNKQFEKKLILVNKRRQELISALQIVKLEFRNDSALCKKYIEGDTTYSLREVVLRMCQMKYLFEYCNMEECKQIAYDEYIETFNSGYFPDFKVFDEAERIALNKYSNGIYPKIFPWLQ